MNGPIAQCQCHVCRTSRAIGDAKSAIQRIDQATEAAIEVASATDMSLSWLKDEVRWFVSVPRWRAVLFGRRRLRAALDVVAVNERHLNDREATDDRK